MSISAGAFILFGSVGRRRGERATSNRSWHCRTNRYALPIIRSVKPFGYRRDDGFPVEAPGFDGWQRDDDSRIPAGGGYRLGGGVVDFRASARSLPPLTLNKITAELKSMGPPAWWRLDGL